jgi:hypothetical protein
MKALKSIFAMFGKIESRGFLASISTLEIIDGNRFMTESEISELFDFGSGVKCRAMGRGCK